MQVDADQPVPQPVADDVLARLWSAYDVDSDAALAREMGQSGSTVGSWRQRQSVPFAPCVDAAIAKRVSLDWLLFGVGPRSMDELQRQQTASREIPDGMPASESSYTAAPAQSPRATVKSETLAACIAALEEVRPNLAPDKKAQAIAALYELVQDSPSLPQRAVLLKFIRNAA